MPVASRTKSHQEGLGMPTVEFKVNRIILKGVYDSESPLYEIDRRVVLKNTEVQVLSKDSKWEFSLPVDRTFDPDSVYVAEPFSPTQIGVDWELVHFEETASLLHRTQVDFWDAGATPAQVLNAPMYHELAANLGLSVPVYVTQRELKAQKEVPRAEAHKDPGFWAAMEAEVDELLLNGASFVVPPQNVWIYSSRWVFTWKEDGRRKARLVVRGYEEKWVSTDDPATESPTLQRESLRYIAFYSAHNCTKLQAWDIKTAFQQADTRSDPEQRESGGLYVRPPKVFPTKYNVKDRVLKIKENKTLYGMGSAPRRFYFWLRGIHLKHGFTVSKFDECLFLYKKGTKLLGIVGYHVDDGLLTGVYEFWTAMAAVEKDITFGTKKTDSFKFCGVHITQHSDYSVELDQEDSIEALEYMALDKKRPETDLLKPTEVTMMRGRLGSLLYVVGNTRPMEAYGVSHLAGFVTEAIVRHAREVDALIYFCKSTKDLHLWYPATKLEHIVLYTFGDSNFKAERGGGSQMGLLSFVGTVLKQDESLAECLRFNSKRAKRVAHSTLTAETLAAVQALDQNFGTRLRLAEMDFWSQGVILTDCRSLFDGLYSMTSHPSEVLVPDFFELREALMPWRCAESADYDGLSAEMWWIPTQYMLADNLTKSKTPSTFELMRVLREGAIWLPEVKRPRTAQRALDW